MRFVETPVFTSALRRHVDDETYRGLQVALLRRPTQGAYFKVEQGYVSCAGLPQDEENEAASD